MASMRTSLSTLLAFVALLCAPPSFALPAGASKEPERFYAELWTTELERSHSGLQAGRFSEVLELSNHLEESMLAHLGRGEGASRALSLVMAYRAFAYHGLGFDDDALWYWYVALGLFPATVHHDFAPLGSLPCLLLEQPFPANPYALQISPSTGVLEPIEISRTNPAYPDGARRLRVSGVVTVEALITEDGRTAYPGVIKDLGAPTVTYAALEAVRHWRYEPATRGGVAVPVFLTVRVTFLLAKN